MIVTTELVEVLMPRPGSELTFRGELIPQAGRMELAEVIAIALRVMKAKTVVTNGRFTWETKSGVESGLTAGLIAAVCFVGDTPVGFILRDMNGSYRICARSQQTEFSLGDIRDASPVITRLCYPEIRYTDIGRAMRAVEGVYLGQLQLPESGE